MWAIVNDDGQDVAKYLYQWMVNVPKRRERGIGTVLQEIC